MCVWRVTCLCMCPYVCLDTSGNSALLPLTDLRPFVFCLFLHRSDASLYCDDVDIRFSKMMNSCKVLQIRYASVERLLERLTDLRFLSIDFLNTFLHSYRVFTSADVVLDKLITIYKKPISAIPAR